MSEPGHWFERDPLWFKTAVFYEVYVRGFFDGNGDGQARLLRSRGNGWERMDGWGDSAELRRMPYAPVELKAFPVRAAELVLGKPVSESHFPDNAAWIDGSMLTIRPL